MHGRLISRFNGSATSSASAHLLGGTKVLGLFLSSLEATVTILGTGVDELHVDGFQVRSLGGGDQRLSQGDWALAAASNASLEQQPVLVDNTVVGETAQRSDALLGQIVLSGGRLSITLLANTQDSLVDLGTVVVTLLTSTCNSGFNTSWMPRSDTGNLAETTMGLSWKTSSTPTSNNTRETLTLGGSTDINDFTFREDRANVDFLFEQLLAEKQPCQQ